MKKIFAFMTLNPIYKKYGEKMKDHGLEGGHYNGYVGFEDSIPGSGFRNDYELDSMVSVHGGITFDGHLVDNEPIIPLTEIPEDYRKYRLVGFDCMHIDDTEYNCDFEFTKAETLSLYNQIKTIISKCN